jgi:two-component system phosphate regulon response regulator PhoB
VGLELGADDYITKPFSPREVVLRVKAVLRRTEPPAGRDGGTGARPWLEAGKVRLSPEGHRTTIDGDEVYLTPTEFNLLRVLLERVGRTQTRGALLSEVWGYADDVDSRTVDTHIRRLRKKLGDERSRIETVIGVGYKLKR